jgi:hypothetical protein
MAGLLENVMVWLRRLLLGMLATATLLLAGCGGSDHRHYEPWQAEGLWSGTTSSGTLDGVVLDTGEYWFIYGAGGVARSVVHGHGYFSRGVFRSDDGADYVFGYDRPFFSSLSAVVEPEFSIEGEIYLENRLERFGVGFVPEYRFPANPAAIVGRWLGSGSTLLSAGDFVIDIDGQGNFTATLAGSCDYGGRILPNRNGRNVFDIAMTSLATCPFLFAANGVMVATGGRLVITALTPDRGDVFYAVAQ